MTTTYKIRKNTRGLLELCHEENSHLPEAELILTGIVMGNFSYKAVIGKNGHCQIAEFGNNSRGNVIKNHSRDYELKRVNGHYVLEIKESA